MRQFMQSIKSGLGRAIVFLGFRFGVIAFALFFVAFVCGQLLQTLDAVNRTLEALSQ